MFRNPTPYLIIRLTRNISEKSVCHLNIPLLQATHRFLQTSALPQMAAQTTISSNRETRSSRDATTKVKTAILMMNMGGPESDSIEDSEKFLLALFKDRDIIKMPFQKFLGPWIAKRRAPNIKAKFDQIGGDPLHHWSVRQGDGIVEALDRLSPETAPHKAYPCFRYTCPEIAECVEQLEKDKAERVVLLSKYPQYSCSTTGSSLNEIARYCVKEKRHLEEKPVQRWSLIDRWPLSSAIVDVYADRIKEELQKLPEDIRDQTVLLFSAHSIPIWMVERGDDYTGEVGGTVQAVLSKLERKNPYSLVWQSKVGPVAWQGPQIEVAIEGFIKNGHKHFMVIPIAFVNEHIETLHELDIEYGQELKEKLKFETFARCPAVNDHPKFFSGMAEMIKKHLDSRETISAQMRRRCPNCTSDHCKLTRDWLQKLDKVNCELADWQ